MTFDNSSSTLFFNDDFGFVYGDLIKSGATVTDFYQGSGIIIGRAALNIAGIGFSFNSIFENGSTLEIDPSFTSVNVNFRDITPINGSAFILAWCEVINGVAKYAVFHADGTNIIGDQVADAESDCNSWQDRGVSALTILPSISPVTKCLDTPLVVL